MAKSNNNTHKEHYIPQFFIKQFYAANDKGVIDEKKSCVFCYDLQKFTTHPAHSEDIFFVENLYETAAINENLKNNLIQEGEIDASKINYFEHKFRAIESEANYRFKKLLQKCAKSQHKDKVLSCKDVDYFTNYMILQLLRIPQFLQIQRDALCEVLSEGGAPVSSNTITETAAKHFILEQLFGADLPKLIRKTIVDSHDMCIVKMEAGQSFFSSNTPVFFFEYDGKSNVFETAHIAFPISPQYCIHYSQKKSDIHDKQMHKRLFCGDEKNPVFPAFSKDTIHAMREASPLYNKIFTDKYLPNVIEKWESLKTITLSEK